MGMDLLILGILLYLIEIENLKDGIRFFLILGRNSLAIYLLSELLLTTLQLIWVRPQLSFYDWVNQVFFQELFPGPGGTLVFAVCYMLLCWSVAYLLDRKKIYIKI